MDRVRFRNSTIACVKIRARVRAGIRVRVRAGIRGEVRDRVGVKQSHGQSLVGIRAWTRVRSKSRKLSSPGAVMQALRAHSPDFIPSPRASPVLRWCGQRAGLPWIPPV